MTDDSAIVAGLTSLANVMNHLDTLSDASADTAARVAAGIQQAVAAGDPDGLPFLPGVVEWILAAESPAETVTLAVALIAGLVERGDLDAETTAIHSCYALAIEAHRVTEAHR